MRTERLRRLARRGSVLLHVMLTSILVATIAAAILRMAMLRYSMGYRSAIVLQEKRDDQGALAAVLATWNTSAPANTSQNICSGAPPGWAGCSNPGVCNCTCTQPGVNGVVVVARVVGGSCQLALTSVDRQ